MVLGARIFTAGSLSTLLLAGLLLVPFPTGWEVGIAIVGLREAGYSGFLLAGDCQLYDTQTGAVALDRRAFPECATGANNWRVDIDAQAAGRPTLNIVTQQPRHTNAGNEPTPHDQPADSRVVTRQRDTWYLDRHIFMFEFQVTTVADVTKVECELEGGCVFRHETSAITPSITTNFVKKYSINGIPFDGSSLVLFGLNPWQGIRIPPEGTIRFDQWVGIMQATIFRVEATKVPNAPGGNPDFPWAAESVIPEGGQPNMFTVQGEGLDRSDFASVSLDQRIPQQVLVELPYKLTAGATVKKAFFGGTTEINPVNVYVKYVVRMDVLTVTGFTPQLDYVDANKNGVLDTGEFTFIDRNNDNLWTLGTDEAVSGTPPTPPPPTVTITSKVTTTAADGTSTTTVTYSDGTTTVLKEAPTPLPSPLQTGCPPNCPSPIQPPPDIFFPSCNFFDIECRLSNWQKFPFDLGTTFALALPIIIIAVAIFAGLAVIGVSRRRGR